MHTAAVGGIGRHVHSFGCSHRLHSFDCVSVYVSVSVHRMCYSTTIFANVGVDSLVTTAITGIINFIATFLTIPLVDKYGRVPLLMFGGVGMCVSALVVGIIGCYSTSGTAGYLIVVFVCLFVVNFAYSWGPVGWIVPSEIFPLSVRGKGVSLTTTVNWLGNFTVSQMLGSTHTDVHNNTRRHRMPCALIRLQPPQTLMRLCFFVCVCPLCVSASRPTKRPTPPLSLRSRTYLPPLLCIPRRNCHIRLHNGARDKRRQSGEDGPYLCRTNRTSV